MFENEFKLSPGICYLNHAAVSPWPQRTVQAVRQFAEENGHLGSRNYDKWLATEERLRHQLKQLVNASDIAEIALLKNTSEALSVVAYGMQWRAGDEVIISNQEFPSNRIVWESLRPLGVRVIEANIDGPEDPEQAIIGAIGPHTRLVSVSSVQYGSGLALDLDAIGTACRRSGVAFCVDAIQSLGVKPFDARACLADFVVADGHKWMLGPEGLAVFYCRSEWIERLGLKQFGWRMVDRPGEFDRRAWQPAPTARRFECGSPNMLGIHALHASLELILETGVQRIRELVAGKTAYLIDQLEENGVGILSPRDPARRAGIVTFLPKTHDLDAKYRELQEAGIVCALRGGGIRFSPHFYTTDAALERAVDAVTA